MEVTDERVGEPGGTASPGRRGHEILALAAVALVCLPVVVGIVTWIGRDWYPVHDVAVIELRTRDVFGPDTPLVGPYSRYGWNHPGPVSYWMLALPNALLGSPRWGVVVAGMAVQLAAIVWTGLLSWRVGRLRLVLVMMGVLGAAYVATGSWLVLEPWNPHLAYPWLPLLCLQAWRLSLGEWRVLPGAVFVASFLVQSHVAFALLVAGPAAVAVAGLIVERRRADAGQAGAGQAGAGQAGAGQAGAGRTGPSRGVLLASALIAAVLWAPVVIEQVREPKGNLTQLVDYFVLGGAGDESPAGGGAALGVIGGAFRMVLVPWGGEESLGYFSGALEPGSAALALIPLVLLAGAYLLARRLGAREEARLVVVCAALVAVAVLAVARATGELVPYLFYWRIPMATTALGAVALVGCAAVSRRTSGDATRRAGVAATGVVLVGLAIAGSTLAVDVATHGPTILERETDLRTLVDQLDGVVEPGDVVRLEFEGSVLAGIYGGLAAHLDRLGVEVEVPEQLAFQFGDSRTDAEGRVDQTWLVIEDGRRTSAVAAAHPDRLLARITPLSADDEAELVDLQVRLLAQLEDAGRLDLAAALDSTLVGFALEGIEGIDPAEVQRLADLLGFVDASERCRCSVVLVDGS